MFSICYMVTGYSYEEDSFDNSDSYETSLTCINSNSSCLLILRRQQCKGLEGQTKAFYYTFRKHMPVKEMYFNLLSNCTS